MTVDELLERFPYDPAKRGCEERYMLPWKLACLESEGLRRVVASGWIDSKGGRDWASLERARQEAVNYDKRYP